MNLRQIKRRHDAATGAMVRHWLRSLEHSESWHYWNDTAADDDYEDDGHWRDVTCKACSGTGGDPWNDGITPCEACDGDGYEWWQ